MKNWKWIKVEKKELTTKKELKKKELTKKELKKELIKNELTKKGLINTVKLIKEDDTFNEYLLYNNWHIIFLYINYIMKLIIDFPDIIIDLNLQGCKYIIYMQKIGVWNVKRCNNYIYFIMIFCIENNSERFRKVLLHYLNKRDLCRNLHKKIVVKYI